MKANSNIIGRETEIETLQNIYKSDVSEFVAIYGRRRVGKTFLVRETLADKFVFDVSGLANANTRDQIVNFTLALNRYAGEQVYTPAKSWLYAFEQLIALIQQSKSRRKVLFFDEIPWMDTHRSGFVTALEHFWNGWASARKDIVLIVCGSATSWIINKLINNHGGLHNRLTKTIYLKPFTLLQCEEYFERRKIQFNRYQIAECYMVMGGIPFYLSKIERGISAAQNIDNLFFSENADLKNEFHNLYASLFKESDDYVKIVAALSAKAKGLSRDEIVKAAKIKSGGGLTKILKNLEYCGFIRAYSALGKQKRDVTYQLVDFYTLFYLKFVAANKYNDAHFWTNSLDTPLRNAWAGYAFEMLALLHINEIKQAMSIAGIQSGVAAWRSENSSPAAQIDLVINRKDGITNIVEIKFSTEKYAITKSYEENLRNKISVFKEETQTNNAIHLVMLTTYGIAQNKHSEIAQKSLTLDTLFLNINK
ncbi:MAG: AAA family ATPase [Prevotellaceae bacterium]|jgi:AAA+ ATPase superfamily predicted ATPase|nr:AAA family ATPase [Prevotellaceae bacterium]